MYAHRMMMMMMMNDLSDLTIGQLDDASFKLEERQILIKTKDFQLEIGKLTLLPEFLKGEVGYRLRNLRTDVIEKEGTSYAGAIRDMYANQRFLDEVDKDPEDVKGQEERAQAQDMLKALTGQGLPGDTLPDFDPHKL